MFNILGKLPAGTSVAGHLDMLDAQKTVRLILVVFGAAFLAKIHTSGDWASIFQLFLMDRVAFWNLLVDAIQAGVTALEAGIFEIVRRFVVSHAI